MMPPLSTPLEADRQIARLFARSKVCLLSVRESDAFGDSGSLKLGQVEAHTVNEGVDAIFSSIQRGGFEWRTPPLPDVKSELGDLLGTNERTSRTNQNKISRILDSIACIAARGGLASPVFDPYSLEGMPFRRSTTVVADTSGLLQGGLDFVARHLHPAARVKVPAIVHMEIVNFVDRFLSNRRSSKPRRTDLLLDHLRSQGGQRVLLRLELHADTEIERTHILGDPLRSAFQQDRDPELGELTLSVPLRAYADRLILEAARHHQAQSNLGHVVQLLTSDQGLARMALAEGLRPLFFRPVSAQQFFGRRLSGAMYHPFNGRLCTVSLSALLWEIATAFGSARLSASDNSAEVNITAIGSNLSWSPYQSHADMLWVEAAGLDRSISVALHTRNESLATPRTADGVTSITQTDKISKNTDVSSLRSRPSFPRFNVDKLLTLVDILDNHQRVGEEELARSLDAKSKETLSEYRRFLASGKLVEIVGREWLANSGTRELVVALRNEDIDEIVNVLSRTPSYQFLHSEILKLRVGSALVSEDLGRSARTYFDLSEITQIGVEIAGEGLYPTPARPELGEFVSAAMARYNDLDRGEGELVSTGEWLEELVRKNGIHPERVRILLNDASASGRLRRSIEGSTTDIRFDNHLLHVLRIIDGAPRIVTVHLYRGDYLIADRSSTSIKIEGAAQ